MKERINLDEEITINEVDLKTHHSVSISLFNKVLL
jgi:hypothetical protein